MQKNTGNTTESNTSGGFGGTYSSPNASFFLADDFTIPAGQTWNISAIDFFAYQTGYNGTTSPYNTVRVNILNSDPSVAGAVSVFGNDSNMYRIFNSQGSINNTPSTTRKIWKISANTPVSLSAGTYWVKYQLQNIITENASFLPSITIPGTRGLAGWNAKQYNAISGTWVPLS